MDFRRSCPAVDLGGEWSFCLAENPAASLYDLRTIQDVERLGLPVWRATVPGNLELDLQANGVIDDPFYGMNIAGLRRLETCAAVYFRRFDASAPGGRAPMLDVHGIDCFATVSVNGELVGCNDNMLVGWQAPLANLRAQCNEIVVAIDPPIGHEPRDGYPRLLQAMASNYESLYVRKAPHMYGWDIMPRALSAGIWRPMRVLWLPDERLGEVYLETVALGDAGAWAEMALHYRGRLRGAWDDVYELLVEGACGGSRFEHRVRMLYEVGASRFRIEKPALWWPRGRGAANLYACRAKLLRNGVEIDELTFSHGVRTIRLDRTEVTDEGGLGEFIFRVNGERVFMLGTNWVPLDAYHSRDIERVEPAIELVKDIGCNAVRCWGGNVYESDAFYDLCDRAGILVWQDFAMACAIYPQDSAFQDVLAREACAVVRRLRQHTCLALWAGDNECDMSFLWGGSGVDPNTNVLTRRVLPEVIRQEDPLRPYLPSSPYIGPEAYTQGIRYLAEDHLWGPRDYYKSEYYQSALCHFASEIGYHGCPSPESIRQFVRPEKVWPYKGSEDWLLHSTSPIPGVNLFDYRVELMAKQVRVLFGEEPDDLEGFAYASQCSQAEAKKFFVEMFRSRKWRRTGIIWWNIVDGWPQFSDAVVDYYFRRKLAYDYIKRSQAPLCLIVREPKAGEHEVVFANDTREIIPTSFSVTDAETGADVFVGQVDVAPDSLMVVGEIPFEEERQRCWRLRWEAGRWSGVNHYLAGRPPFRLDWYRRMMAAIYGSPTGTGDGDEHS